MTKACKIFFWFFAVFAMTRPDYFIISQLDLNFELLNPVIKFWYKTQINYVLLAWACNMVWNVSSLFEIYWFLFETPGFFH